MDRVSKAERELVRKLKMQTNYDRVISKSPEELAKFISSLAGCPLNVMEDCPRGKCVKKCKARDCWHEWLKQEANDNA